MESFHVFDVMIDAPHVKRKFYLPTYIERITGVLFFPVVPIPRGVPDGEPLGVAALSVENEKLNIVSSVKVFKKAPCYYAGKDLSDAMGEVFLDRGYGHYDFYGCNDAVSRNSYALFKYTNRKIIKSLTEFEQFQIDAQRLKSLENKTVTYNGNTDTLRKVVISENGNMVIVHLGYIKILSATIPFSFPITRYGLRTEIYKFLDPDNNNEPFFHETDEETNYDEPYKLKIILRHEIDK